MPNVYKYHIEVYNKENKNLGLVGKMDFLEPLLPDVLVALARTYTEKLKIKEHHIKINGRNLEELRADAKAQKDINAEVGIQSDNKADRGMDQPVA